MEATKTTSPKDQNPIPARWQKTNPHPRAAGFILLYSLWVLTAISLTLAVVSKQTKHTATPAQLGYSLQKRQLINILDYVIQNSYKQTINNDSRIARYQQQINRQQKQKTDSKLEFLKALLKQMGMSLDIGNKANQPASLTNTSNTVETTANTPEKGYFSPATKPYTLKLQQQSYNITIKPANIRPNLNTLPQAQLQRYLQHIGLSPEKARQLTDRLIDWIDPDKFIHGRYGAEWAQYTKQTPPYKPRNNPLQSWQEINYIYQASPDLVELLQQHFVLHSQEKVIADELSDAAIAALVNIDKKQIKQWRSQKQQLTEEQRKKIAAVIGQKPDPDNWIIRITSADLTLTAWFNWKKRTLQDWIITP